MRKIALLFIQIIFISTAYGQGTEYSLHLDSGLFHLKVPLQHQTQLLLNAEILMVLTPIIHLAAITHFRMGYLHKSNELLKENLYLDYKVDMKR